MFHYTLLLAINFESPFLPSLFLVCPPLPLRSYSMAHIRICRTKWEDVKENFPGKWIIIRQNVCVCASIVHIYSQQTGLSKSPRWHFFVRLPFTFDVVCMSLLDTHTLISLFFFSASAISLYMGHIYIVDIVKSAIWCVAVEPCQVYIYTFGAAMLGCVETGGALYVDLYYKHRTFNILCYISRYFVWKIFMSLYAIHSENHHSRVRSFWDHLWIQWTKTWTSNLYCVRSNSFFFFFILIRAEAQPDIFGEPEGLIPTSML